MRKLSLPIRGIFTYSQPLILQYLLSHSLVHLYACRINIQVSLTLPLIYSTQHLTEHKNYYLPKVYLYYHFRERLWNQVLNGPQSCMGSLWKDFVVISGEKSRILCLVSSLSEVSLRPDHSRNKLDLINSRVIIEMQTMQQILFRSQFIEIKTNEQTKCIKCLTIKTPFRKVIIITVIKELKIRGDRTAMRHWDYVCSKSNVWNRNSIVLLLKITIFLPENVFQAAMI